MLKFFDADPGCKKFGSGMEKFESGINIPEPQHWLYSSFFLYLAEKEYMQKMCCPPSYFLFCELFLVFSVKLIRYLCLFIYLTDMDEMQNKFFRKAKLYMCVRIYQFFWSSLTVLIFQLFKILIRLVAFSSS
jgi:hypothetical protein